MEGPLLHLVEQSGPLIFNVPFAAIQVDECGFPTLLKVRCALTDVASTLILPPLSSIGDELWRTMDSSKETQESA